MPLKDLFLVLKEYPNVYVLFTLRNTRTKIIWQIICEGTAAPDRRSRRNLHGYDHTKKAVRKMIECTVKIFINKYRMESICLKK